MARVACQKQAAGAEVAEVVAVRVLGMLLFFQVLLGLLWEKRC